MFTSPGRVKRLVLATLAALVLFAAGTAAAGVDLRKIVLRPGHCLRISKISVCAAKARPAKTVTRAITITAPAVTSTVTAPAVTQTVTTGPTVTVTTTPTPQTAFGPGTFAVGTDIVAGTYKSLAATTSCYWERLSGFGGTLDEVIANYFGDGPTYVTISPSDVGFHATSDCGNWTKVG